MPVVLFTLYEENTIEGIKRHFDSLVKILFGEKSLIKVWKMPVSTYLVNLRHTIIQLELSLYSILLIVLLA